MSNKAFVIDEENYLLIDSDVLRSIASHAQHDITSKEQGGVLIGQYRGANISILSNTTPQKGDVASRFRFERKCIKHRERVLNEWRNSKQITTYVGEWHTHPEDHPTPSSIDVKHWNKELTKNKKLILVIQGRKSLWVGSYYNGKVLPLSALQ